MITSPLTRKGAHARALHNLVLLLTLLLCTVASPIVSANTARQSLAEADHSSPLVQPTLDVTDTVGPSKTSSSDEPAQSHLFKAHGKFNPLSQSFNRLSQAQTADSGSAACTFSLSTAAQSFASGGGTGSVAVTAAPGCNWTARSNASWIKITSGGSGTGDGTLTFSVAPATNRPRSGTLTIAGKIFNVWQEFNSCGAPIFKAARTYPLSIYPTQLVTADFNRDRQPDLAALQTLSGENHISVMLNTGGGGFGTPTYLLAGSTAQDLSTADLNNDGNDDLIATDLSYVQIFYGDGTGGFSRPTNIRVTTDVHYAADPADFNRDGKIDLAVSYRNPSRYYEDYVTILLGDGTGRFTRTTTFIEGSVAAIADVNRDNKQDLAVSHGVRSGLSVYLGDGTGAFGQEIFNQTEREYLDYTITDMNGDGQPDLVSGVGVQLGDKKGHFSSLLPIPSLTDPLGVTVGDFNSDGKPDIAGSSPGVKFAVALGDGTGKVKTPVYYSAGGRPFTLVAIDINGDRQLDLAAAAYERGISVLLNACHAEPGIKISGRMMDQDGKALNGYLTLSSPRIGTIITHAGSIGDYSFKDINKDDVYTVNAFQYPYDFTTSTVSNPATNQVVNFKGVLRNFSIKGKIIDNLYGNGIGGVTVELSGWRAATTQTDENGEFLFENLPPWHSYTITIPPSTICSFQYGSSYTIYSLNYDGIVNFWATRQSYDIGGQVKEGTAALEGVTMRLTSPSPAGFAERTAITSIRGRYSFGNLPAGRTYIIKATKAGYTFSPSSTTYSYLSADQSTGDFTATPKLTASPEK